jgi:hypothetical protein
MRCPRRMTSNWTGKKESIIAWEERILGKVNYELPEYLACKVIIKRKSKKGADLET